MTDETDETEYPFTASEGGDNAYIHGCDVYGGRRHYACCLQMLKLLKSNAPDRNVYDTECRKAITQSRKNCPAIEMRVAEQKAGKALYYVPRRKIGWPDLPPGEIFKESFERGFRGPRNRTIEIEQRRKSAPTPTPRVVPVETGSLHAELVTKLVKENT